MVVPRKKPRRMREIGRGGEARVYRRHGAVPHRKVVRITQFNSSNIDKHPNVIFYATKIAELVHPQNFIYLSGIRAPRNGKVINETSIKGTEFYSKEVKTRKAHKKLQTDLRKAKDKNWIEQEIIAERYLKKVDPKRIAEKKADQLRKEGFELDSYAINIDMIKRKPFFFEVTAKDPRKIWNYVKNRRIDKNFTAEKKARALRLASRLIQVFDAVSLGEQKRRISIKKAA